MKELLDNDSPNRVHAAELFDLTGLSTKEKKAVLNHYSLSIEQPEKF